jgi:hypothetical protein
VPGKEGFYRKLGLLRMLTAMAIFEDPAAAVALGHLSEHGCCVRLRSASHFGSVESGLSVPQ